MQLEKIWLTFSSCAVVSREKVLKIIYLFITFCADEAARVRENKTSRDKASRSSQNEWFKVYDKVDKPWFINSRDMQCKNISNPL